MDRPMQIAPPESYVASGLAPAAAAGAPRLTNHGGPVLGAVEVVPIFWGAAWAAGTNATLSTRLEDFFDFVLTSTLMTMLAEYGTPATPIGTGTRLPSARITDTEPGDGSTVSDDQIQTALQGWVADGTVPPATANTLYFLYLPPGVVSTMAGGAQSCGAYCGYHNAAGALFYAVIPFADCNGCVFPGDILDTLTVVSSHELAEAVTDPALNAWFDPGTGSEIGDICNRDTTRLGGFLVQTEWSNARNACVVAPAGP